MHLIKNLGEFNFQDREYIVKIDFSKESYMPGDIVRAKVDIKRLYGQPLPDSNYIKFQALVRLVKG